MQSKPPLLDGIGFSQAVYDEEHRLLRLTLAPDGRYRLFTPLKEISPALIAATLLQEDRYFYCHPGVNPFAICKAVWQTYFSQTRPMGASTITMQVARLRYGIHSKNLLGKLWQIVKALQLELFYSKAQILEAYLNLASYGGNIEGVGAASLIYFEKQSCQLTLAEAMRLSVVPQNPLRRALHLPDQREQHEAYARLIKRWIASHPMDTALAQLTQLPPPVLSKKLPFRAPHFVEAVLPKTSQSVVVTTLNLPLQKLVETMIWQYLEQHRTYGLTNGAAMLVDVRNMEVKALVGSGDYFDPFIAGQVNGAKAKRSPGSALKPFIYALAIDQGIIHPHTVLKDTPHSFGGYNPENFERDFLGPIKAKDALALSRNIPAIDLMSQLKEPTFHQFLRNAGVTRLKSASEYGLSLALGSAEVTMEELATLYAMLANRGVWQPLKTHQQPKGPGISLISPEACFLTLDMLRDTPRPYTLNNACDKEPPVYWKTGTSSNYRDGWSIGIFGPFVLAVWVGDFRGNTHGSFTGAREAGPLFFQIVAAVNQQMETLPDLVKPDPQMNLIKVEVCEASGQLPNPYCPKTVKTWFIPGKSPIKQDTVHRNVAATLDKTEGDPPTILTPQLGMTYSTRLNRDDNPIYFAAVAETDVDILHWFVDHEFIGSARPEQLLAWEAKAGTHTVSAVDNLGRASTRTMHVTILE